MKAMLVIMIILLFAYAALADTPAPGVVQAKTYSGNGATPITATGSSLNVNVTNASGLTTVNQGNAGAQSWLAAITSSALPTNACIETGGHLASIDSKLTNPLPVSGTFWQTTQPVSGTLTCNAGTGTFAISAASLPLPSGASTSSLQSTGNTALSAISAQLPATLGAKTITNSLAVNIASDQTVPVSGTFWQTTQPVSGTFWQATQPVSLASVPLPTGAATAALQTSGNTTLTTITGQLPATLGAKIIANSFAVNIASDQTVPVSGTFWQTTQPVSAASLPLPSGASTSALQSTINTTLGSPFQVGGSIGNTTFAATQSTASSLNATVVTTGGVAVAKDSSLTTINTTLGSPFQAGGSIGNTTFAATQSGNWNIQYNAINSTGSQTTGNVSTVITLTAPSNAYGFILEAKDANTANIRYAIGATATTTVGQQLQPGRDTGFVPVGANVSVVSESGTQEYQVQWISTH